MSIHKVKNLPQDSFNDCIFLFENIISLCSIPMEVTCFSMFSDYLDIFEEISNYIDDESISVFFWKELNNINFFSYFANINLKSFHLIGNGFSLTVSEYFELNQVGWPGTAPNSCTIVLTSNTYSYEDENEFNLDKKDSSIRVRKGQSFLEGKIENNIIIEPVKYQYLEQYIQYITTKFHLNFSIGAFEGFGRVEYIKNELIKANMINLDNYPKFLYSLCRSNSKFSIQPLSWKRAVFNTTFDKLKFYFYNKNFDLKKIKMFSVKNDFLSWRYSDTKFSQKISGNFCELLYCDGKLSLSIGIDQYLVTDPPARLISKYIKEQIKRVNLYF